MDNSLDFNYFQNLDLYTCIVLININPLRVIKYLNSLKIRVSVRISWENFNANRFFFGFLQIPPSGSAPGWCTYQLDIANKTNLYVPGKGLPDEVMKVAPI